MPDIFLINPLLSHSSNNNNSNNINKPMGKIVVKILMQTFQIHFNLHMWHLQKQKANLEGQEQL